MSILIQNSLFIKMVHERGGGQKCPKTGHHGLWMPHKVYFVIKHEKALTTLLPIFGVQKLYEVLSNE